MLSKKQKKTWEEMRSWGLVCMKDAGLAMLRPGVGWFRVAYWSEEENRGMAYKGRIQKSGAIQIGSASPVSIADQEVAGRRKHHETRRRGLV